MTGTNESSAAVAAVRQSHIHSPTALRTRAADLNPLLRERAGQTEQNRQVSAEVVQALQDGRLFRVLQPKHFGGLEQDLVAFADVIAELGKGCGSTAWVYGVLALHQWVVAMFPLEAQQDVWGSKESALISGSYAPSALAQAVEGGYRISGRWTFASGCDHADWHLCGALLPAAQGGAPAAAFMLVPRSDFRIDDTWHTMGLCGTGSKDVVIENALVPHHRVVPYATLSSGNPPGAAVHSNPLYRIPFLSVVPISIVSPSLGMVEDALNEFIETARERTTKGGAAGGGSKLAQFGHVQTRVAEASGYLDAARLLLLRDMEEMMTASKAGAQISVATRIRNRRDYALVIRFCQQAIDAIYACVGGAGLFKHSRAQRAWRDIHATARHIGLNWDAITAMYGQHALGLEPHGQY